MTIYNFSRADVKSPFKPGLNDSHNDTIFIKKINAIFEAATKTNPDIKDVKKFTARLESANGDKFYPVFRIERVNKKPLVLNFSRGNNPITLCAPQLTQSTTPKPPTQATPLLRTPVTARKPAQLTTPLKSSSSPKPQEPPKKTRLDEFLSFLSSSFRCFAPPRKKSKSTTPPIKKPEEPSKTPAPKSTNVASCQLRGLPNQGNTCFMAATFQAIMNDEVLRQTIEEKCCEIFTNSSQTSLKTENALKLWNAIQNYKEGQVVDLNSLRHLFLSSDKKTQLTGYERWSAADAVEFLYRILDFLDNANYYDEQKNLKIGLIKGLEYTCDPVNATGPKKPSIVKDPNPSFVFQVDLNATKGLTGQQIIDNMLTTGQPHLGEPFDIDGALYRPTLKRTVISTPPERFAISLERFAANGTKNTTAVDMPETLKMGGKDYRLKSIVVHTPGHYYSYVNRQENWFKADDSTVTPVSDITAGRQNGYLYFYEKT